MSKQRITALLAITAVAAQMSAQHYDMNQWGSNRGYYDAPYHRYEAERDYCRGFNGTYLEPSDDQRHLQSEASNQQAITLNEGGYVEWTNDTGEADGVTLRYSLPYGRTATVAITGEDGSELCRLDLDTDHSWEFCEKIKGSRTYKPEYYSIHRYADNEFPRMRFDEKHKLLSRALRQGEKFRVKVVSGNDVTVDFVEIEKARFVGYQDGWVRWNQQIQPNLQEFINANQGRTIYIDQDYVGVWGKLNVGNCTLQGRGIFYTELHWEQNGAGFNGFDGAVKDMTLSSYQNQRYDSGDHSPNGYGSPGKCFNGRAAQVENVLVEHFECGGWVDGSNSHFTHCRFRNNYADGMNFCNSSDCSVTHSNFRNNGDDDMASWSAQNYCNNNEYAYNTAEHNWRASSIGFFGGGNHKGHHLLIKDGLESGARLVSDFSGPAFGEGIVFSDIAIVHCGCIDGEVGVSGDFWGVSEGALHIEGSNNYDLQSPRFENIDIYHSRGNAVYIGSVNNNIRNLLIDGIRIDGIHDPNSYAFFFENAKGNGTINNVEVMNVSDSRITNLTGGELKNGQFGNFQLTTSGVEMGNTVIIDGCRLELRRMAWNKVGRGNSDDIVRGDKVAFTVRVDNASNVDLPEDYPLNVRLSVDDGTNVEFPSVTGGLKAGASAQTTCTWTATTGGHAITATLDPYNRYGEMTPAESGSVTKRINVGYAKNYDFTTTSGVDFEPVGLEWKTQNDSEFGQNDIKVGDRVTFAAVVANCGTRDSEGGSKLGVIVSPSGNTQWSAGDTDYRWCDQNEAYEEVKAGSVKMFPMYGGNNSSDGIWTAREGTFNVGVLANDHANEGGNRSEDNTANNTKHFALTIPYANNYFAMPDTPDTLDVETEINVIEAAQTEGCNNAEGWFALSGIRLESAPARAGVYVHGGKKVVVK